MTIRLGLGNHKTQWATKWGLRRPGMINYGAFERISWRTKFHPAYAVPAPQIPILRARSGIENEWDEKRWGGDT